MIRLMLQESAVFLRRFSIQTPGVQLPGQFKVMLNFIAQCVRLQYLF